MPLAKRKDAAATRRNRKECHESKSLKIENEISPNRIGFYVVFFLAVFGCALFILYTKTHEPFRRSTSDRPTAFKVEKTVEILGWPKYKPFADFVARKGEPIVLRNTFVDDWSARSLWNPSYLRNRLLRLTGIYVNRNRWFGPYYDVTRPLARLTARSNAYETNATMSSVDFFHKLTAGPNSKHVYFSGEIEKLGNWAMDDVMPMDEFLTLNPEVASVNVWMGQAGVIAHCHYDGYHNFYTQLYGKKRFTLFRPSQWSRLYPYPFLHPSHAQCQVNLSDPDLSRFPLVTRANAVEVVLEPGDVLYMPPLWFHHVESISASIAVNVWTDSAQSLEMQRIYETTNPALDGQAGAFKALAAMQTVIAVIRKAAAQNLIESSSDFILALYRSRYENLMRDRVLPSVPDDVSWPWKSSDDLCAQYAKLKSSIRELESQRDTKTYVVTVVQHLANLPNDTRELWLGNYVESLAATVASPELVGQLLRDISTCVNEFYTQ